MYVSTEIYYALDNFYSVLDVFESYIYSRHIQYDGTDIRNVSQLGLFNGFELLQALKKKTQSCWKTFFRYVSKFFGKKLGAKGLPDHIKNAETPEEKEHLLQEYITKIEVESGIKLKREDITDIPNPGMGNVKSIFFPRRTSRHFQLLFPNFFSIRYLGKHKNRTRKNF